ncbi:MAG TPA: ATP-grasp fold amidoligase family protein [bacterium]|nr:ATP-grasp fold amidoligase family protein [bacterium]
MQRALERAVKAVLPEQVASMLILMRRHKLIFGVYPNLLHPVTYNEKLVHRILFDRRPIWARLQDKYAVREYVKERIGEQALTRLYWVTKDPADIPFDALPDKFVVKPTHASGWIVLVQDKTRLNQRELVGTCQRWLRENFFHCSRERPYKSIVPRIMIEEYINDGTGLVPRDYKLHVFDGRVEIISVMAGRFQDIRCTVHRRPWTKLDIKWGMEQLDADPAPPRHLEAMIEYAEALAKGLDYVRVDLYDTADKVYFGELTPTPGAGTFAFEPREFDNEMGKLWSMS